MMRPSRALVGRTYLHAVVHVRVVRCRATAWHRKHRTISCRKGLQLQQALVHCMVRLLYCPPLLNRHTLC